MPVRDPRRSPGAHPPFPTGYLQLAIGELRAVRPGANRVGVVVAPAEGGGAVELVEVQLGVIYERGYLELLAGPGA